LIYKELFLQTMALIGMCIYCTDKNKRDPYLYKALQGLVETVDFSKHTLGVSVNGHTEETLRTLDFFKDIITYKYINNKNIGTSEAVNKVLKHRKAGQHFTKIDDDMYIHDKGWLDQFEEVVTIDPSIAQCGVKRVDVWENVYHENPFYRTTLYQLPHKQGDRWIVVEVSNHIIGSCILHSSLLLDKVGYFQQITSYGMDDSLMSYRSQKAGFKNVFLPHVVVEHLDVSPPLEWHNEKMKMINDAGSEYFRLRDGIVKGEISYYYNPYINADQTN